MLVVALPALILFSIEGTCRLLLGRVDPMVVFVPNAGFSRNESESRSTEGDPDLGWRLRANVRDVWWEFTTFSSNSRHVRGEREISAIKPDLRIVCLGDSVTFGYRIPLSFPKTPLIFNREEKRYPELLEEDLHRQFPNRTTEVITMAALGYTTHQGLIWLEREIPSLKPDLVTILFGFNDTSPGTPDKVSLSRSGPSRLARHVIYHSQAMIHLLHWLGSRRPHPQQQADAVRVSQSDYLANIEAIVDLAKHYQGRALVIGQCIRRLDLTSERDRRIKEYRLALAERCRQDGIPYLEIPELTEAGWPGNEKLFGEDVHPGLEGHKLIAERLVRFILDNRSIAFVPKHRIEPAQ